MDLLLASGLRPFFDLIREGIVWLTKLAEKPEVARFFQMIADESEKAATKIRSFFSELASRVGEFFRSEQFRSILTTFVILGRSIWEILKAIVTTIAQVLAEMGRAIGNALTPVRKGIDDFTQGTGRSMSYWAGFVTGAIVVVIRGLGSLLAAFTQVFGSILRVVIAVGTLIARAMVAFLSPFSRHSPSVVEQVEAGRDRIAQAWQSLPGMIAGPLQAVSELLRSLGRSATEAAGDIVAGLEGLKQRAIDFWLAFSDVSAAESGLDSLRTMVSDVAAETGGAIQEIVDQARQLWAEFTDGSLSAEGFKPS